MLMRTVVEAQIYIKTTLRLRCRSAQGGSKYYLGARLLSVAYP